MNRHSISDVYWTTRKHQIVTWHVRATRKPYTFQENNETHFIWTEAYKLYGTNWALGKCVSEWTSCFFLTLCSLRLLLSYFPTGCMYHKLCVLGFQQLYPCHNLFLSAFLFRRQNISIYSIMTACVLFVSFSFPCLCIVACYNFSWPLTLWSAMQPGECSLVLENRTENPGNSLGRSCSLCVQVCVHVKNTRDSWTENERQKKIMEGSYNRSGFSMQRYQHTIIFVPVLLEGMNTFNLYFPLLFVFLCATVASGLHADRSIVCSPCLERDRVQPEPRVKLWLKPTAWVIGNLT